MKNFLPENHLTFSYSLTSFACRCRLISNVINDIKTNVSFLSRLRSTTASAPSMLHIPEMNKTHTHTHTEWKKKKVNMLKKWNNCKNNLSISVTERSNTHHSCSFLFFLLLVLHAYFCDNVCALVNWLWQYEIFTLVRLFPLKIPSDGWWWWQGSQPPHYHILLSCTHFITCTCDNYE